MEKDRGKGGVHADQKAEMKMVRTYTEERK